MPGLSVVTAVPVLLALAPFAHALVLALAPFAYALILTPVVLPFHLFLHITDRRLRVFSYFRDNLLCVCGMLFLATVHG